MRNFKLRVVFLDQLWLVGAVEGHLDAILFDPRLGPNVHVADLRRTIAVGQLNPVRVLRTGNDLGRGRQDLNNPVEW